MKKFFVIVSVIVGLLVSGCASSHPGSHPPANYIVHFVNETSYRVRVIEDGIIKQRYILPGQPQVFGWTVSSERTLGIGYRLVAYRTDSYSGKEIIVASANFSLDVRGGGFGSVISRVFVIKYDGGLNLLVDEARGPSSTGFFGW